MCSKLIREIERSITEGTVLSSHLDNLQNLTIYWVFPNQKQTLGGGGPFWGVCILGGSAYVRSSNTHFWPLRIYLRIAYGPTQKKIIFQTVKK